jgi:hypothetical protein
LIRGSIDVGEELGYIYHSEKDIDKNQGGINKIEGDINN